MAGGLIKLPFKALKAMSSGSSYKIKSGLLFSKTYRGWLEERNLETSFCNNQIAQENLVAGV